MPRIKAGENIPLECLVFAPVGVLRFSKHVKSLVLPTLRGNADLLDVLVIANNGTDFGETEGNIIVKYLPDNGVRRMFHE